MKKLMLLLLLFTGIVNAQITLGTSTPYSNCATYYQGTTSVFNLYTKNAEILATNSSSLYSIQYYETLVDAIANTNPMQAPTGYVNTVPNNQTVFARVWENANPSNFATASLNLIVVPLPITHLQHNYSIYDNPFDGFATFDLTTKTAEIMGTQTDCIINYYENQSDAMAFTNAINNLTTYTNTINTNQTIYYRLENVITGCYFIGNFSLLVLNSAVLSFPDAYLKLTLLGTFADYTHPVAYNSSFQPVAIDTNNDGEIDQNEADSIYKLNITYFDPNNLGYHGNIQNLNGLGAFTNLNFLGCYAQSITSIDTSQLTHLTYFNCGGNNLTTLDVTPLTQLTSLVCWSNQIGFLNVAPLTNLTQINCAANNLSALNVSGLTNLGSLDCSNNHINNLNVGQLTNLSYLSCGYNQLTTLDVAPLTNLTTLVCDSNQITTLDVAGLINLTQLGTSNNPISYLALSQLTNLTSLNCWNNLLPTLDVSTLTNLTVLYCGSPQLTTLFMKNGKDESFGLSGSSPNLQYICADESQIATIQATVNLPSTTVVSTYCNFTPGGNYNKVTGVVRLDNDNNGCDANDTTVPNNVRLNFTDGIVNSATFLNTTANYTLFGSVGSYVLTPSLENPTYFNISPTSVPISYTSLNSTITNQDFCLTANGVHNDVEVVIAPITSARPGFDAVYQLVYKNKGNQTDTVYPNFMYDSTRLSFVSSTVPLTLNSAGHLTWTITGLQPFQSGSIEVTMHVNAPTDTPPVNIGDVLVLSSFLDITTDENWADNSFTYNQTVVGSFDPNDITCIEGNVLPPAEIGNYLHYIINFENTGTADAENIVVKDIIDTTQFDVNSLQILNSSTPVTARLTGNVAEFIFQNINLHSGGHGNILIKIKSKNTLVQGDTVSKKANIYFDYNAPINTNLENTIFQALSSTNFEHDNSISIYPNPTKGNVNINCNNTIKSVQLFDVQGRLLQTNLVNENQTVIDISNQSTGIYFLKITSEKGIGVQKIVRE